MNVHEKEYVKDDLKVVWKKDLCIHSANCVSGLKEVFNPDKRPWIDLSKADQQVIKEQIDRCPSGALSYITSDQITQRSDQGADAVEVEVLPDGPLALHSSCQITLPDGSVISQEKASYFCRCGASANKPFCDGSHKKIRFKD